MLKFEDLEKYGEFKDVINLFSGWLTRAALQNTCHLTKDNDGILLNSRGGQKAPLAQWLQMLQYYLNLKVISTDDGSFAGLILRAIVRDNQFKSKAEGDFVGWDVLDDYRFEINTVTREIDAVSGKLGETVKLMLPDNERDAIHAEYRRRRSEYEAACEKTRREFAEAS